jgi:N-acetylmuramoyl-L-alanine amidase
MLVLCVYLLSDNPYLCSFLAIFDRLFLLLDLEGLMRNGWRQLGLAVGCLIAAAVWMTALPQPGYAAKSQAVQVYVDGAKSGIAAQTMDGVAYVPLDSIAALGGQVTENNSGGTYTLASGRKEIRFTVGDKTRFVDGTPRTSVQTAVKIGMRVHVPLGWLSDIAGLKYVVDRFTQSVYVFHKQEGASVGSVAIPRTASPSVAAYPSSIPVTLSDALPTLAGITLEGDALTIAATGEVQPQLFQLKGPDRIVVDLPKTTVERAADGSASGTIPVDPNHPYISGIRYSLFAVEPAVVRIVVDLKQAKAFQSEPLLGGMGTVIRFSDRKPFSVMIDPGHGATDPGAISVNGRYEKDLTLAIALKVQKLLDKEKLIQPVMLRADDAYKSPVQRAEIANLADVNLFISIHANTASTPSVKGTETYYWKDDSAAFAQTVHKSLLEAFGSADRKVKKERFIVIRETKMPAVLLELGFLTNAEDEAKLYNENMQDRIAESIVKAIKTYYSVP